MVVGEAIAQGIAQHQQRRKNRLEKLLGNRKNFYSIRINDQWRIIFKWNAGTALEVEITDYH